MPYIERKKINGRYYLYLYETYRVPDMKYPKRRMLRYLGPEKNFEEKTRREIKQDYKTTKI